MNDPASVKKNALAVINWLIAVSGIAMTAWFIDVPPQRWDRFLLSIFLMSSGPYLLLGLGCHISRRLARARVIGFGLLVILLLIPGAFYAKALIFSSDAQAGFVFLSVPFFMWIYSGVAFFALGSSWLNSKTRKQLRENEAALHGKEQQP